MHERSSVGKRLLGGLLFSTGIGMLAYRRGSLSRDGVVGAVATGTTIYGLGGFPWALGLIFFFVSSSFFSHFRAREKERTAADKFSKGSRRDVGQVAANGGVATALAVGYGLSRSLTIRARLEAGYIGALATATADTWATELGVLSPERPRLITSGKVTEPGTSGGVTGFGTTAAAGGALALGVAFRLARREGSWGLPLIALVSGLAGSVFDSVLGATVQTIYFCPACNKETERQVHSCGTRTRRLRGWRWMNNDVVNFLATLVGAGVAVGLHAVMGRGERRGDGRG